MNIKEAIKEQIIISKVKKEAKVYHRKSSQYTLMECQDIIAQNYGYRHWHEFHTNIKNNLLKYQNIEYINNNGGLYIGREKLSGNKIYLNSYFNQINIVNNEYSNEIIKILSEQIINQNNSILVCVKDSKITDFDDNLEKYAKQNNIKIYNLTLNEAENKNGIFFDFSKFSSGFLTQLLFNQIEQSNDEIQKLWHGKAISILSIILSALIYLNKEVKIKLTPEYILKSLDLDYIINLSKNEDLPSWIKNGLKKYIYEVLPCGNELLSPKYELHEYLTMIFIEPLKKLILLYDNILQHQKNKISFSNLLDNQEKFILLIDLPQNLTGDNNNWMINYIFSLIINDINVYHGGDINKTYKNQQNYMKYSSYFIIPKGYFFNFTDIHNPLRL